MPYLSAERRRVYQRDWLQRRRAEFFAGKTCDFCESSHDLELHHRDPSQKVAHAIWSWSPTRRAAELVKCRVLCAPCHRRLHVDARTIEADERNPCGTYAAYKRGCSCVACRAANAAYQQRRRDF